MTTLDEQIKKVLGNFGGVSEGTSASAMHEEITKNMYEYLGSRPETRSKLILSNKEKILPMFQTRTARKGMEKFFDDPATAQATLEVVKRKVQRTWGLGAVIGLALMAPVTGLIWWFALPEARWPIASSVGILFAAIGEILFATRRHNDLNLLNALTDGLSEKEGTLVVKDLVNYDRFPNINADMADFGYFYNFLNTDYPKMVNEYLDKSGKRLVEKLDEKRESIEQMIEKLDWNKEDFVLSKPQVKKLKLILEEELKAIGKSVTNTNATLERFGKHIREIKRAAKEKRSEIDRLLDTKEFLSDVKTLVGDVSTLVDVADQWEIVVSQQLGDLVIENEQRVAEASQLLEGEVHKELFLMEHDLENEMSNIGD